MTDTDFAATQTSSLRFSLHRSAEAWIEYMRAEYDVRSSKIEPDGAWHVATVEVAWGPGGRLAPAPSPKPDRPEQSGCSG